MRKACIASISARIQEMGAFKDSLSDQRCLTASQASLAFVD